MEQDVRESLTRLKKTNKLLGVVAVVALAVAVTSVLVQDGSSMPVSATTSDAPKVVKAEKFELVDSEGNVRGELGFTSGGVPRFMLYDDVSPRILMFGGDSDSGPSISLSDRKAPRLKLELEEGDKPALTLQNYVEGEFLVLRPE